MRSFIYRIEELLRLRQHSAWLAFHNIGTPEVLKVSAATRSAMEKLQGHCNVRTSSDESRDVVVTLPDATEWQYRGRAGDELGAPQPLSAPSGIAAQKDEGFQRFYKAVVSPTHVRVTAGGRIVPNTRGSQSPSVRKETPFEPIPVPSQQHTKADASTTREPPHPATPVSVPLGYPAAFTGYPASMFAHAQFPFPHIPLGFGLGGGLPLPPFSMNRHISNQSEPLTSQPMSHTQGLDGAGGVRISPPGQFDPTRPYFVNGQWMLPFGAQAYPYGLHPLVAHPGLMNHYGGSASAQGQVPAQTNAYSNMETQSTQTNGTQPPTPHNAPAHPPISSIRPSQITKCHIESLKNNLKRVEDQLQYNVHQIDVKHMEGLAKEIRASINALQDALPKQLEFEELHYPRAEKQEAKPNGELFSHPISHGAARKNHLYHSRKGGVTARAAANAAKGTRSVFSTGSVPPGSGSSDSEHSRRFSGLPITAATAPPFQPYKNHIASKHTASSGDGSGVSKDVARSSLSRPGTKNPQAMAMNIPGEYQEGSVGGPPKPLVNGCAKSPTHATKDGVIAATAPKPVPASVVTPVCAAQKDMGNASESSKTVRIRRPEDRSGRKGNDLWHSILKKGSPSSNALPGEVTSITAQGYLPHFGSQTAAASLTPTIANTGPTRGSIGRASESDDKTGNAAPGPEQRGENRPPVDDLLVESQQAVCL